ncbi:hypothetical protein QL992_00480 [Microbacterium sp. APC 3898]|uniref:Uncharacterized protein n=2 Tax=Planococcus TaxID=1372 RepID=A0ABT7ZFP8_9BACL|nr:MULTISPECIES: hypothetical protein [Terrabacteria group]MBD8013666.1 hypothetical protein [Planococcus wigleyi]MDN3425969.1 hypothetical protein [Planococcus sp. APC 4016]MDN3437563.1 hypothetical protein [Planococcus sp. APC 3900]MDN3497666.1 hypothetical protein [Microbacterium sp. APC 3898]
MNEQTNWWEPIFTGQLEVGVNKEKLESVTEESILYYEETSNQTESAF